MLAQLRHPAIVTIFDAHLDAVPPYLVLEYVEGESLAERLRRGPLSITDARAIAAAAATGLVAAHAAGIVHRDIKPDNILIPRPTTEEPAADARLVDFGIAHSVDAARNTTAGSIVGSASYLSPEQALGETLTSATDVYSLGLVLIEAILGRPAFSGTPDEVLGARLVRSPDLADTALAGDAHLLARMTAIAPADRPSAVEVVEMLSRPVPTRVLPAAGRSTAATAVMSAPDRDVATERLSGADVPTPAPVVRSPRRRPTPGVIAGIVGGLAALILVAAFALGAIPVLGPVTATSPTPAPASTADSTDEADEAVDPAGSEGDPGNGHGPDQKKLKKPKGPDDRP